ncbi:MAG: NADH-quinone oxidoreductase subunit, partial [Nocardioidaceae bacterium]|nr:NADH-quinone oxidoreductase subunit [Nocardioidaceae bacterium]
EKASTVVLVGFEPEDEAGAVFLRLRKASRNSGVKIVSIASHTTRGLAKMSGELIRTVPGEESAALAELELDSKAIILVGERLASVRGGFTAALAAAEKSGASLAWIPRRAGDRGSVEAGCLPSLLPGGRPLDVAEARADLAAAWGVRSIPSKKGRDTSGILDAATVGTLKALVVAGVEVGDLPDPAAARAALDAVGFLVSLEVRESEVSSHADVVLPVAPMVEKPGSFVNWEGRIRTFDAVLREPNSLTDTRVLAGIAEELGRPLGFRTIDQARAAMQELGPWDGDRPAMDPVEHSRKPATRRTVVLDTWPQLVDDGRAQDGQELYRATARPAVLLASAHTLGAFDIDPGKFATVSTEAGSVTFPAEVADLPDGVVWAPANSGGTALHATLGAGFGDRVSIAPGKAPRRPRSTS